VVFVTSAGIERNALIGDDEVARKKDIPIVQLNPGGTLNHKYAGEWALRSAGLPYSVIRSTGLHPSCSSVVNSIAAPVQALFGHHSLNEYNLSWSSLPKE